MQSVMSQQFSTVRAGGATAQRPIARSQLRQPVPLRFNRLIVRAEQAQDTSETVAEGAADLPKVEVPRQKSSWEIIEEPVRGKQIPDGGPPVSQRNNDIDDIVINFDGAREREFTGLPVSFADALRFKGAAPEIVNCRLAMLGAFAGLTAELASGKSIVEQFRLAPGPITFVFFLIIAATLIPIVKGVPRKGAKEFGGLAAFDSDAEVIVGRVAMLGIFGTILTEAVLGHAVL